ncbi:MAG: AAA family ATPase [Comamonas sp.]
MTSVNLSQTSLGREVDASPGSINLIVRYDRWPKRRGGGEQNLREAIARALLSRGAPAESVYAALRLEESARQRVDSSRDAARPSPTEGIADGHPLLKDPYMLLRKQTINRAARQHFKLLRDPFTDEMLDEADVFVSDDIRYVRASMRQTAKHGGMLAVVGESGGGKSTLRQDLAEWINVSHEPITVIEPYVIGMEDSNRKGKALKSADITGAVIRAVAPGQPLRASLQDRAGQMHDILKASAQVGRKHVLIIEEAHCLAIPTLKHLKRFYELQDGFKKLLAIILIGQTELGWKLSEHNPEVREVVQRCELVNLPPLDNHVEGYLRHKLGRAGLEFDALIAPGAVDEIRARLRTNVQEVRRGKRETRAASLCYPLAINNLVSAAMNEAVKIGEPRITAELIAAAVGGE